MTESNQGAARDLSTTHSPIAESTIGTKPELMLETDGREVTLNPEHILPAQAPRLPARRSRPCEPFPDSCNHDSFLFLMHKIFGWPNLKGLKR